jgi:hypothetical protein
MTTEMKMFQKKVRARSGGRMVAVVLAASVAMAAVAGGVSACRASGANTVGPPVARGNVSHAEMTVKAAARTQAPIDTVVTTLGPSGFTPAQVGHAAGRFNVKVRNQSGEREVILRLSDSEGKKVSEARLTDKVKEWVSPVELATGTYTVTEANHPAWTCRVEVTAQ